MSPAAGKIQRAVLAAFEAEPDNAFTSAGVIERTYPGLGCIESADGSSSSTGTTWSPTPWGS